MNATDPDAPRQEGLASRAVDAALKAARSASTQRGAVALVDQGVASVTNFATRVIIGRAVAREQFGLYMLGLTVILFVEQMQTALISTPYTVYSPRLTPEQRRLYTGSTLLHQFGLSALGAAAMAAAAGVLHLRGVHPDMRDVLVALSAATFFFLLRDYARRVCFARLELVRALWLDLTVAAFQIGGLLIVARQGLLSAAAAFAVVGFACAVAGVRWLIGARHQFGIRLDRVWSALRGNWRLSKWIVASGVAREAGASLYPWFLAAAHGTGVTGAYAACAGVIWLANPFVFGMMNFLQPASAHALATGGRRRLNTVVLAGTAILSGVMCLFCVGMLVGGGWLVALIYGEAYAGHGQVVSLMAVSYLIASMGHAHLAGLLALERSRPVFFGNLAAAAVTLALGLPLVRAFGLVGAALALVAKDAASCAVRVVAYWSAPTPAPAPAGGGDHDQAD